MPLDRDKVLLIGLDAPCEQLFHELKEGQHGFNGVLKEEDHQAYMISTYNDEVKRIIYDKVRKNELVTNQQWQQFMDGVDDYVTSEKRPLWKEFMVATQANPKNQWTNIFAGAIQSGNIGIEWINLCYVNEEKDSVLIKELDESGSKIGIDLLKCYPDVKAYVTLDGVDMRYIENRRTLRNGFGGQLRKMLRYMYRVWPTIKDQVTFLSNSRIIAPPWREGEFVKSWQNYIEIFDNKISKQRGESSFLKGIHTPEEESMCTHGTKVLSKLTIGLTERAKELNKQKKSDQAITKIQGTSIGVAR